MSYSDFFMKEVKRLEKGANHRDAINQLHQIVKSADDEIELLDNKNLELLREMSEIESKIPSNKVYMGLCLFSAVSGYLVGVFL